MTAGNLCWQAGGLPGSVATNNTGRCRRPEVCGHHLFYGTLSLNVGDSASSCRHWRNGAPRTGVKREKMGDGEGACGSRTPLPAVSRSSVRLSPESPFQFRVFLFQSGNLFFVNTAFHRMLELEHREIQLEGGLAALDWQHVCYQILH